MHPPLAYFRNGRLGLPKNGSYARFTKKGGDLYPETNLIVKHWAIRDSVSNAPPKI